MKRLYVFADFDWLKEPRLIGELSYESLRGSDSYGFCYSDDWLRDYGNLFLSDDLNNYPGQQYTAPGKDIFGCFSDALPDRWGRTLINRREQILAKEEKRPVRRLSSFDYLVGIEDYSRMGGLRFKESLEGEYINASEALRIPPLTDIRELIAASSEIEKSEEENHLPERRWIEQLVLPFKSIEWEKLNTYFALLIHKLPVLRGEDFTEGLIDSIDFDQYRIIKEEEQRIELENSDAEIEPIPIGTSKGKSEPEMAKLSEILDEFNGINWLDKDKEKQQLEELPERLQADEAFVNAARNSDRETAQQQCNMSLMMIIAQMLNENTEFCRNYLDNPDFMNFINQKVFRKAYDDINK